MLSQSLNISIPRMPGLFPLGISQFKEQIGVHGYKERQVLPQLDDEKRAGIISGSSY